MKQDNEIKKEEKGQRKACFAGLKSKIIPSKIYLKYSNFNISQF
jgi:hypothetical protein